MTKVCKSCGKDRDIREYPYTSCLFCLPCIRETAMKKKPAKEVKS